MLIALLILAVIGALIAAFAHRTAGLVVMLVAAVLLVIALAGNMRLDL
jgi:hypothetical protein